MKLNLKLPRRNPAAPRPSLRERYDALKGSAAKVIRRRPAPAGSPTHAADPILAAITTYHAARVAFDAIEAELEQHGATPERWERESALGTAEGRAERAVWQTVPSTPAGRRALVEFARFRVARVTHPNGDVDDGGYVLGLVLDAFSAMVDADPSTPAPSPAAIQDPHVALLPALRQAYAWDRASRPISSTAAMNSPEEEASGAVIRHCWDTASRIVALPAPRTLAGLGALALALSVQAEDAIGPARYEEERRHAAAIRAMMSIAGVDPLPDWCGFGDEPDPQERYVAMLDRMGAGSLPAWALAGKSGPDEEYTAAPADVSLSDLPKATSPAAPSLDLSGYSVPQLCSLFDVYEQAEGQFYAAGWWPKLGNTGAQVVADEGDRCLALKGAVADELQKRKPNNESDADERGERLMRRKLAAGDWDAAAELASSLRDETAALTEKA